MNSSIRPILRRLLRPLLPTIRTLRQMPSALRSQLAANRLTLTTGNGIAVCYLTQQFPKQPATRTEYAAGGAVKMTYLAEAFPHSYEACNILYVVSSVFHPQTLAIVTEARRKGIKIVLNQNGVYYRAWFGSGWEKQNKPLARLHQQADYIIYQSKFCGLSAERFLGNKNDELSTVLPNPVDLDHYKPLKHEPLSKGPILLALGSARSSYRMECAVRTVANVRLYYPNARLFIPGLDTQSNDDFQMMQKIREWAASLGLPTSAMEFAPRYTRQQARLIFNRAHLLLHPVYNDASPNLVVEALACGLPIVYSASGGVPELVGEHAGIGLPAPLDWEVRHPPDPVLLANAVCQVAEEWDRYSRAARQRAVDCFGLKNYISRHRQIFQEVLNF